MLGWPPDNENSRSTQSVHNATYIKMTIPAFHLAIFNSGSFIDGERLRQWLLVSLNTLIVNRRGLRRRLHYLRTIAPWSIKIARSSPISQLHLLRNVCRLPLLNRTCVCVVAAVTVTVAIWPAISCPGYTPTLW